jgi:uncharacterized membrane protein
MTRVEEKLARKSSVSSSRQVRLTFRSVNVWSALKISFLAAFAAGLLSAIGIVITWSVLNRLGVFDQLDSFFSGGLPASGSTIKSLFGFPQALGLGIVSWIVDVVCISVIGTLSALLYNLSVRITGGINLGFSSDSR